MNLFMGENTRQLIEDIIHARHDPIDLAQSHGMTPQKLAVWIDEADNQRCLTHICMLADMQTPLLLSRYRSVTASRLIKLATEDGKGDVARRACMDVLHADLKRAHYEEEQIEADDPVTLTRSALYSKLKNESMEVPCYEKTS